MQATEAAAVGSAPEPASTAAAAPASDAAPAKAAPEEIAAGEPQLAAEAAAEGREKASGTGSTAGRVFIFVTCASLAVTASAEPDEELNRRCKQSGSISKHPGCFVPSHGQVQLQAVSCATFPALMWDAHLDEQREAQGCNATDKNQQVS